MDRTHPSRARDGDAGGSRVLGLAGWGLARQMDHLAEDLPRYRVNILAKIADVRGAGKGGSVEKLQDTIEDIKTDLGKSEMPRGTISRPVVVTSEQVTGFSGFAWLSPIVGPLGTAGLVAVDGQSSCCSSGGFARSVDRAVGHGPSRHHDEGV
jgi:hypothetical protein